MEYLTKQFHTEKLAIVYNHFTLEEWMCMAEGVRYLQPLGLLTGEEVSEILKKFPPASL